MGAFYQEIERERPDGRGIDRAREHITNGAKIHGLIPIAQFESVRREKGHTLVTSDKAEKIPYKGRRDFGENGEATVNSNSKSVTLKIDGGSSTRYVRVDGSFEGPVEVFVFEGKDVRRVIIGYDKSYVREDPEK